MLTGQELYTMVLQAEEALNEELDAKPELGAFYERPLCVQPAWEELMPDMQEFCRGWAERLNELIELGETCLEREQKIINAVMHAVMKKT
jgi:hypothetical protein